MSRKNIPPEVRSINLYKHLPVPACIWNVNKNEIVLADFNASALEFFGPSMVKFIGQNVGSIYADAPQIIEMMDCCRKQKQTVEQELEMNLRKTSKPEHLKCTLIWIDPDIILFMTQDLTEAQKTRIRLEQLVAEQTEELRAVNRQLVAEHELFSKGPVIAIVWGAEEHWPVRYVSENVKEVLGYTAGEMKSPQMRFASLLHPEDQQRIEEEARGNIENKIDSFDQFYRLKTKTGEYRWFYDSTVLERDEQGKVKSIRGYILDQTEQKNAELVLQNAHAMLEDKIRQRTADLAQSNLAMQQEIHERIKSQEALLKSDAELEQERASLQESNIVLKVLMREAEQDRARFEERVSANLIGLVDPYLAKLKKTKLDLQQSNYINIIEANLNNLVSPFVRTSTAMNLKLTPTEIQIANLIKDGKSSKQIAEFLGLSLLTIEKHRGNIRKKLGISNQKVNLKTLLISK